MCLGGGGVRADLAPTGVENKPTLLVFAIGGTVTDGPQNPEYATQLITS